MQESLQSLVTHVVRRVCWGLLTPQATEGESSILANSRAAAFLCNVNLDPLCSHFREYVCWECCWFDSSFQGFLLYLQRLFFTWTLLILNFNIYLYAKLSTFMLLLVHSNLGNCFMTFLFLKISPCGPIPRLGTILGYIRWWKDILDIIYTI